MTEPRTRTELLKWLAGRVHPDDIAAIEAEASRLALEEVAERVRGLEFRIPDWPKSERHPYVKADVALAIESVRAAVLSLLSTEDDRKHVAGCHASDDPRAEGGCWGCRCWCHGEPR